jgi:hypothetical protein
VRCAADSSEKGELKVLTIKTASWFTKLPAGHVQVGISRGTPRHMSGYRRYSRLEPGPWFKSVSIAEYLQQYGAILRKLDPLQVAQELAALVPGAIVVMACYESANSIIDGTCWCHRHLAAQWLEDRLGINVEEIGHPNLDRFARLQQNGIEPPRY